MADAADGFVAAEDGGNVEDMGAEFCAYQHDPERHQQLAGFDGCGSSHFFKVGFEGGGFEGRRQLELSDQLCKELRFRRRPFWFYRIEIDGRGGLEEEAGLLNEVGQQMAAVLYKVQNFLKPTGRSVVFYEADGHGLRVECGIAEYRRKFGYEIGAGGGGLNEVG